MNRKKNQHYNGSAVDVINLPNPERMSWVHFSMGMEKRSMDSIRKCVFWSHSIKMELLLYDNDLINSIDRICFIANIKVEKQVKVGYEFCLLTFTSKKDLNRMMPILKEKFSESEYMSNAYLEQYENFFKDEDEI